MKSNNDNDQSPGIQNNVYHLLLVSTLYRTHRKYHTILLYLRHIMFRLSIITPYHNNGANKQNMTQYATNLKSRSVY